VARTGDTIAFLRAEDLAEFDALLTGFLSDTNARAILLVDRTGRLLASAGETQQLDGTAFATLAAADFGASDQLATLVGEREFASLYHHGERSSLYLTALNGLAILATLFDDRTTLGMIRLKLKSLVPTFEALLVEVGQRSAAGPAVPMDSSFAAEAESEIDRLFSEG
jgi:predicted regulator of Ras-like GTPase activity (Roadblock/LC7/MglB family)